MKNNKLKAFVRFDGSGRIVPSSLILQRSMPKVGNWKEIPSTECCNFIPPILCPDVNINGQIWTGCNLDVSTYRNGDIIPQITNDLEWQDLTTGAWCYYDNDPANEAVYGKLYNWYAVNDPRGIGPLDYHVPDSEEIFVLQNYLNLDNISEWPGLPAGMRNTDGSFSDLNDVGAYWSSTLLGENYSYYIQITTTGSGVSQYFQNMGFSIRLIKD